MNVMGNLSDVVITVNSPGEVATWLKPVMRSLEMRRGDGVRATVLITPCVYASGTEERFIRGLDGVDEVLLPKESLMLALFGRKPIRWKPVKNGVLLHLGGDLALSSRVGKKLGFPAFLYTDGYIKSPDSFTGVFTPYETTAQRISLQVGNENKVMVTGNLMVDSAKGAGDPIERREALNELGLSDEKPVVALFPGSRPYEISYAAPFFVKAASAIERAMEEVQVVLALSPFSDGQLLHRSLANLDTLPTSFTIWEKESTVVMAAADVALTIPGSVSAELAAGGVAHVIALPLDRPEDIPLDGILGYVNRIPIVGKKIKRTAVLKAAREMQFISIPNRIAGEMILPELKSEYLTPDDVAAEALSLLADESKRKSMSERLVQVMGSEGAANIIVSKLLQRL